MGNINNNNGYIKSSCIKVYPCAYRDHYNLEARANSEDNFKKLSAAGLKGTYVVNSGNEHFQIILGQYYFEFILNNEDQAYNFAAIKTATKWEDATLDNSALQSSRFLITWENNSSLLDLDQNIEGVDCFTGIKFFKNESDIPNDVEDSDVLCYKINFKAIAENANNSDAFPIKYDKVESTNPGYAISGDFYKKDESTIAQVSSKNIIINGGVKIGTALENSVLVHGKILEVTNTNIKLKKETTINAGLTVDEHSEFKKDLTICDYLNVGSAQSTDANKISNETIFGANVIDINPNDVTVTIGNFGSNAANYSGKLKIFNDETTNKNVLEVIQHNDVGGKTFILDNEGNVKANSININNNAYISKTLFIGNENNAGVLIIDADIDSEDTPVILVRNKSAQEESLFSLTGDGSILSKGINNSGTIYTNNLESKKIQSDYIHIGDGSASDQASTKNYIYGDLNISTDKRINEGINLSQNELSLSHYKKLSLWADPEINIKAESRDSDTKVKLNIIAEADGQDSSSEININANKIYIGEADNTNKLVLTGKEIYLCDQNGNNSISCNTSKIIISKPVEITSTLKVTNKTTVGTTEIGGSLTTIDNYNNSIINVGSAKLYFDRGIELGTSGDAKIIFNDNNISIPNSTLQFTDANGNPIGSNYIGNDGWLSQSVSINDAGALTVYKDKVHGAKTIQAEVRQSVGAMNCPDPAVNNNWAIGGNWDGYGNITCILTRINKTYRLCGRTRIVKSLSGDSYGRWVRITLPNSNAHVLNATVTRHSNVYTASSLPVYWNTAGSQDDNGSTPYVCFYCSNSTEGYRYCFTIDYFID